jgi:hypothetical protein
MTEANKEDMKNELCDVTTIFAYGGLEETICII